MSLCLVYEKKQIIQSSYIYSFLSTIQFDLQYNFSIINSNRDIQIKSVLNASSCIISLNNLKIDKILYNFHNTKLKI